MATLLLALHLLTAMHAHAAKEQVESPCDLATEMKVHSLPRGKWNASQESMLSDQWSCVPRPHCDPVFQFTAMSTANQHVCKDYPRKEYILTSDQDLSAMQDAIDWQGYFDNFMEVSLSSTTGFPATSEVHVHSCVTEHTSDDEWKAFCSVHFEPENGEPRADVGRPASLAARARLHAQERGRRGFNFGGLDNAGQVNTAPDFAKTCSHDSTQFCCLKGYEPFTETIDGTSTSRCVECDATGFYSDVDTFPMDSTDDAARCKEHPKCIDDEGLRFGFWDNGDGSSFLETENFLTNVAAAICKTKTDCNVLELLTVASATEWVDTLCGVPVVQCSTSQFWVDYAEKSTESEWFEHHECADLDDCTADQIWTNKLEMNADYYKANAYVENRKCIDRPACPSTDYLKNANEVLTAKDGEGFWMENNFRASDCRQLVVCNADTQYEAKSPKFDQRGEGEECESWCSLTDTDDCGFKKCYGCDSCFGPAVAVSERECADATPVCDGETYESRPLTTAADRRCSPWKICDSSGEFEVQAPNNTHDRACELASDCNPYTQFESKPLTAYADRECSELSTAAPTATPTAAPTAAPTDAPTAAPTAAPVPAQLFSVYRPFFGGDVGDLVASFDRWDEFPPCELDSSTLLPTSAHLPVDMVLYFAQTVAADPTIASSVGSIVDAAFYNSSGVGKRWRNCFSSISLLGAELTTEQDQYHNDMDDPTWNSGPNHQYYKLLQHVEAGNRTKVFYYMEGDSIPSKEGWLDSLAVEIDAVKPFSVLGGRYHGHNWDTFTSAIIEPALENHLNGNGVYNVSSGLVADALVRYEQQGESFSDNFQDSFDVHLCKMLMNSTDYAESDLEGQAYLDANGYVASDMLSNFATTLAMPQHIPSTAQLIHGAVYVNNWPNPGCDRSFSQGALDSWYPGVPLDDTEDTSMTLVVSDFGDGMLNTFMESVNNARIAIRSSFGGTCASTSDEVLPFSNIEIITQNDEFQSNYSTDYETATTKIHARNWTAGPSAWWDLCDAPVSTEWFMLVTSYFEMTDEFSLPIDVNKDTGQVKALAPYLNYDSPFCGRECRQSIEAGRTIDPKFNRHFGQEYAIFKTDIRDAYCAHILSLGTQTTATQAAIPTLEPSVDGYFAFIMMSDASYDAVDSCNAIDEVFWCSAFSTMTACGRDDELGDHVRTVCPATCGTCGASEGGIDSGAADEFVWHDEQANFDWWERKVSSGSYGSEYTVYDRERLFVVTSFSGEEAIDTDRCENREWSASNNDTYTDCPCVFPFYYKGYQYSACTTAENSLVGGGSSLWCPTSTANMGEYLEGSRDVRLCVAGEGGDRRSRRDQGGFFQPELNSNALLKTVRKARNATHYTVAETSDTNTGPVIVVEVDSGTATAISDFTASEQTQLETTLVNQIVQQCNSGCFYSTDVDAVTLGLGSRRTRMRRGTMTAEILLKKDTALSKVVAVADAVLTCSATSDCSPITVGSYTLEISGVTEVQPQADYATCLDVGRPSCTGSYQDKSPMPTSTCTGLACSSTDCCDQQATCTDTNADGTDTTDDLYVCTSAAHQLLASSAFPTDCDALACSDNECCEQQATCTDANADGTNVAHVCAGGLQLLASLPADCNALTCSDNECCEQQATCTDADADGTNAAYVCASGFQLLVSASLPADCDALTCNDEKCCEQQATCTDADADSVADDDYVCASGFQLLTSSSFPAQCSDTTCTDGECCERQATCTDADADGNNAAYACASSDYVLKTSSSFPASCSGTTCSDTDCCNLKASCADTDADGVAGDVFTCTAGQYEIKSTIPTDACTNAVCTDAECCDLLPTCADSNADGSDVAYSCGSGYLLKNPLPAGVCATNPCTGDECCDETTTTTSVTTTTTAHPMCSAGEYRSTSDPFTEGTCTECADGTYTTIPSYETSCAAYPDCAAGLYRPNAADDPDTYKECQACPNDTFRTGNGGWAEVCIAHTTVDECVAAGKWSDSAPAPTASTDRECKDPTECVDGSTYERAPLTATTDRICVAVADACDSSTEYESTPPTTVADRVCLSLDTCILHLTYESTAPTPTTDRQCSEVNKCSVTSQYMSTAPTLTDDTVCVDLNRCGNTDSILSKTQCTQQSTETTDIFGAGYPLKTADNTCVARTVCDPDIEYVEYHSELKTLCTQYTTERKVLLWNTIYKDEASYTTPETADLTGNGGTNRMRNIRTSNACPDANEDGSSGAEDCVMPINTYAIGELDKAWDTYGISTDDPRAHSPAAWIYNLENYDAVVSGQAMYNDPDITLARTSDCGFVTQACNVLYFSPIDWFDNFSGLYNGQAYHIEYDVFFKHQFDPAVVDKCDPDPAGDMVPCDIAGAVAKFASGSNRDCTVRKRSRSRRQIGFGGGAATSCPSLGAGEERCSGSGCGKVCCKVGYGSNGAGDACLDCGDSTLFSGEYYSDASLFRDSADQISGTEYECKVQPNTCGASENTMYKSIATSTTQLLTDRCDDLTNCQLEQDKLTASEPSSDYEDRTCGDAIAYCATAVNGATVYWSNYDSESSFATNSWTAQPTCTSLDVCTAGSTYWSNRGSMRIHAQLGSWLDNRVCSTRTPCNAAQFINNTDQHGGNNNEIDNECAALVACTPSLQFEQIPPTPSSQRLCKTAEDCSTSEYEDVALTPTTDRSCASISSCDETSQWESEEPTPTSDRTCSPVTTCVHGQELEEAEPTPTSDRVCAATTTITTTTMSTTTTTTVSTTTTTTMSTTTTTTVSTTTTTTTLAPAGSWVFDPTKTCTGHCDGSASHTTARLAETGWKEVACYCDQYCRHHGDCCDDIFAVCAYDRTTAATSGETTTFTDTTYTHTSTTVTQIGTTHTHTYGRDHPHLSPSEEHQNHWAHEGPAKQQDPGTDHSDDRRKRSEKRRRNKRKSADGDN